jgi:hypothetical protein
MNEGESSEYRPFMPFAFTRSHPMQGDSTQMTHQMEVQS